VAIPTPAQFKVIFIISHFKTKLIMIFHSKGLDRSKGRKKSLFSPPDRTNEKTDEELRYLIMRKTYVSSDRQRGRRSTKAGSDEIDSARSKNL